MTARKSEGTLLPLQVTLPVSRKPRRSGWGAQRRATISRRFRRRRCCVGVPPTQSWQACSGTHPDNRAVKRRLVATGIEADPAGAKMHTPIDEIVLAIALRPCDIVSMRSPFSNDGHVVRAAIQEAKPHRPFLPPSHTDPNPGEQVSIKPRYLLRQDAGRTMGATWRRIGALFDRLIPREFVICLVNSGCATS